jgi:CCR4-NOT complex subunit CAF16
LTAPILTVTDLSFTYPRDSRRALEGFSLELPPGVRCLVVGRNGAGKSTLLHILAGKHMVPEDKVRVLGRPAFHDTSLAAEVTFLGGPFRFDVDIVVADILARTPGLDRARVARIVRVLDIDTDWHMHRVSDGQRRRVQILLGLVHPSRLLLLDEVTTDLDLIARVDLLELLREETERHGATILYATHIFDALEDWATHVAYVRAGRLARLARLEELGELSELRRRGVASPLYRTIEGWFRSEMAGGREDADRRAGA